MNPGDQVCFIDNPSRRGIVSSNPPFGEGRRRRLTIVFPEGPETVLMSSLEKVTEEVSDPYVLMQQGRYGGVAHLRDSITLARLSGKLANLIYSLNTTNTKFLAYQFKPVLQFLDSPSRGILIADEVGLGKTIEAGLIWTELRAREDARRLLVVCPAMLRDKWRNELKNKFGVKALCVDAGELHIYLQRARHDRTEEFALIVSMQGVRPPRKWDDEEKPPQTATAKLSRFLRDVSNDEPILDFVIIDEAHYLRNENTQTHTFVKLLRPATAGIALLSATPIQTRSTDLFNLLRILDEVAFQFEWAYDASVRANAPLVALRDRMRTPEVVTREDFRHALQQAIASNWFEGSEQMQHLLENLPTDDDLLNVRKRANYAELLDRLNPRAKIITRTLKRHVDAERVEREPQMLRVSMTPIERKFYDHVTNAVRAYCERQETSEGFLLTIPQRQMSSCMAAACLGWHDRDEASDFERLELLTELNGEHPEHAAVVPQKEGTLVSKLVAIAREVGDYESLYRNDSKFRVLLRNLKGYWTENPAKKVVLFAFYRNTLHYLEERLAKEGIRSVVAHGGVDKGPILQAFEKNDEIKILLSSEVASEGVDLQFSSLLINYDLPWNPARIEQRIGRIDRIGQPEPKILIWNLIYEDTVDERVYERLLDRLDVFRTALGNMEELLGAETKKLTLDLLTHRRTPAQEEQAIAAAAFALEQLRIQEEALNTRAHELLGHGDFIKSKAQAAMEHGRYIRNDDLYCFVKNRLEQYYPGSRVVMNDEPIRSGNIELSIEARAEFDHFLKEARLIGRTTLLQETPKLLEFDNHAGKTAWNVEKITQDHPLVRFLWKPGAQFGIKEDYFPTSAVKLRGKEVARIAPGIYVYVVVRWNFSGPKEVERLVYDARSLETGAALDPDMAELLINTAAVRGVDWQGSAKNMIDHQRAAALQDDCRATIEEHFGASKAAQFRENRDRIREMNASLDADLRKKRERAEEDIRRYENSDFKTRRALIAGTKKRLEKLEIKYAEKKHINKSKENFDPREKIVSSGVIFVEY